MSITQKLSTSTKVLLSSFVIVAAVFSTITISTNAQNIGIKPFDENGTKNRGIFKYIANAGDIINDAVLVVNSSTFDGGASVKARDAETDTSGNLAFIADEKSNTQSGSWIKLAEEKVVVPAQKALKIPFVLTIPKDTKAGEYAAGIAVSPTSDTSNNGGLGVQVRSATTVYITVRGDLKIDNQVSEFSIVNPKQEGFEQELDNRGFIKSDNMVVKFKGVNVGNIYSQVDLKINIETGTGEKKEIPVKRVLNLNSSYQYYYINTGLPYTAGNTKASMSFVSSPYNLTSDEKFTKTSNSDGQVDYNFSLSSDDLKGFDALRGKLLDKRTADIAPSGDTAQKQIKPEDFKVKEIEPAVETKKDDNKNNNGLVTGLITLIAILVIAFVAYIVYSKKNNSDAETSSEMKVDSETKKEKSESAVVKKKSKK